MEIHFKKTKSKNRDNLYVIELKDRIKVGTTDNSIDRRVKTILTQGGFLKEEVHKIHEFYTSGIFETKIHEILKSQHKVGEWFYKKGIVLKFLRKISTCRKITENIINSFPKYDFEKLKKPKNIPIETSIEDGFELTDVQMNKIKYSEYICLLNRHIYYDYNGSQISLYIKNYNKVKRQLENESIEFRDLTDEYNFKMTFNQFYFSEKKEIVKTDIEINKNMLSFYYKKKFCVWDFPNYDYDKVVDYFTSNNIKFEKGFF